MEVVKVNQAEKILLVDVAVSGCFEFNGSVYMRIPTIKTAVIDDQVIENILAVNLEDGRFFFLDKEAEAEVSVIPLHSAKVVVE